MIAANVIRNVRETGVFSSAIVALLLPLMLMFSCMVSDEEQVASIYSLKMDTTEKNLEKIRLLIDDENRDVRATALYALATVPVPDAVDLCINALDDTDFFVRTTAATLLGDLGDSSVTKLLVTRLQEDVDWHVRFRAAESLEQLEAESALDALVEGLEDPMKEVRLACVSAVMELGPASAVERLSYMVLNDKEWEVKVQAARALGASRSESALPAVRKALEDPNEFVRAAAAYALVLLDEHAGKSN